MSKWKSFTLLAITLCVAFQGKADEQMKRIGQFIVTSLDTNNNYQTIFLEPDETINAIFSDKLDSLVNSWYISNIFLPDSSEFDFTMELRSDIPDSLIVSRLQAIEAAVNLSYNNVVRNLIEMYTQRKRNQVEIMLGLTAFYFPIFEEILDRHNMPLELKYLAIIESALNPRALSRAGAMGLWQFMYGTAKHMGLEVTTLVDERRDVLKATDAAARYLKQLYDIYQDWHLVIAAYNCGPGNINKAIRRSGGKTDYWQIYHALPRETRGYVPAYIAASYVMNYYREHKLVPRYPAISLITDTLMVTNYLNLKQVADKMNMDLEAVRDLNPMYRRDVVPATPEKPYPLRLPNELVSSFIDQYDSVFSHERETHFPNNRLVEPQSSSVDYFTPADIKGKARLVYTVKSGDNPGFIANWYNVRLADLRYWNNLNRNIIRVGQKLVVYVPEEKKEHYERVNLMSFAAKQEMIGKTASPATSTPREPETIDPNFVYYTVKSGDNLWSISQKFPGITDDDIKKLNNITNIKSLYPGQMLKIKPKGST